MVIVLGACIIGMFIGVAILVNLTDKNSLEAFVSFALAVVCLVTFIVTLDSALSSVESDRAAKNKNICSQIPTAQWISDNDTCIKDGKVIILP